LAFPLISSSQLLNPGSPTQKRQIDFEIVAKSKGSAKVVRTKKFIAKTENRCSKVVHHRALCKGRTKDPRLCDIKIGRPPSTLIAQLRNSMRNPISK